MSNVQPEIAFKAAVELVKSQDENIRAWFARLFSIQSSLVIAEAALLGWKGEESSWLVWLLALLVGILSIVLTVAISRILVRHRDWATFYVHAAIRAEGKESQFLYQDGYNVPGIKLVDTIRVIKVSMITVWSVFLVAFTIERILRLPSVVAWLCRVLCG